ncbi:conjugation system SOS inhibitor PsiB family protein [Atlantibacter hermannii]|uniref:conjugation system SOS inhibitor PsiB family protein n=1 Tax=Atlantibacter hermannii TaxID=565 RepID=UPI00254DC117|nr:conjugation system SOS inhibitor PsiB family protein [Atlantibacter hermannii]
MLPARKGNGHPVSVVRTLAEFNPQLISHTLRLTARLDSDGYPADFIIHTLAMEGAR